MPTIGEGGGTWLAREASCKTLVSSTLFPWAETACTATKGAGGLDVVCAHCSGASRKQARDKIRLDQLFLLENAQIFN